MVDLKFFSPSDYTVDNNALKNEKLFQSSPGCRPKST